MIDGPPLGDDGQANAQQISKRALQRLRGSKEKRQGGGKESCVDGGQGRDGNPPQEQKPIDCSTDQAGRQPYRKEEEDLTAAPAQGGGENNELKQHGISEDGGTVMKKAKRLSHCIPPFFTAAKGSRYRPAKGPGESGSAQSTDSPAPSSRQNRSEQPRRSPL